MQCIQVPGAPKVSALGFSNPWKQKKKFITVVLVREKDNLRLNNSAVFLCLRDYVSLIFTSSICSPTRISTPFPTTATVEQHKRKPEFHQSAVKPPERAKKQALINSLPKRMVFMSSPVTRVVLLLATFFTLSGASNIVNHPRTLDNSKLFQELDLELAESFDLEDALHELSDTTATPTASPMGYPTASPTISPTDAPTDAPTDVPATSSTPRKTFETSGAFSSSPSTTLTIALVVAVLTGAVVVA